MPKRKRPELKPEEQFERFQEAARKAEADETGKTFEKAFKKLTSDAQKPRRPRTSSRGS